MPKGNWARNDEFRVRNHDFCIEACAKFRTIEEYNAQQAILRAALDGPTLARLHSK
jgi:hypothetical protein